jgi:histone acetyltransferase (RNA polymerase elongator complex component)
MLMQAIEDLARSKGINAVQVPSSLTARGFYALLGYQEISEVLHGEERTILMTKVIQ